MFTLWQCFLNYLVSRLLTSLVAYLFQSSDLESEEFRNVQAISTRRSATAATTDAFLTPSRQLCTYIQLHGGGSLSVKAHICVPVFVLHSTLPAQRPALIKSSRSGIKDREPGGPVLDHLIAVLASDWLSQSSVTVQPTPVFFSPHTVARNLLCFL